MTTTTQTHRILGINDDETSYCLCGKQNLKKVVWLAELDTDGNHVNTTFVGTTCASYLLTGVKTVKAGNQVFKAAEELHEAHAMWLSASGSWADDRDSVHYFCWHKGDYQFRTDSADFADDGYGGGRFSDRKMVRPTSATLSTRQSDGTYTPTHRFTLTGIEVA